MNTNYDKYNNAVGPQVRAPRAKAGGTIPALAALSLLAGLQCATQFFAHEFQYQSALGAHFQHLYAPWSILLWASKWHAVYPEAILRAGSVGILPTGAGLMALVFAKMWLANSLRRSPYLHGSARWANLRDIQVSGLLPRPRTLWEVMTGKAAAPMAGVYVGAWLDKRGRQHYLRHNGPEHVLCYAPQGPARVSAWWYRRFCPGARAR